MGLKIYACSGDGNGAGKSTLAQKLVGKEGVISLAAIMRAELQKLYPQYDWFNKDQSYKENTKVTELEGKSVRQVLIEYGQSKCEADAWYWVRALAFKYKGCEGVLAIDDLRKLVEIDFLRGFFGPTNVVHFHVSFAEAKREALYDNDKLRAIADYVIVRPSDKIPAAYVPNVPETRFQWHFRYGNDSDTPRGPKYATRAIAEQAKQGLIEAGELGRIAARNGDYILREVPK